MHASTPSQPFTMPDDVVLEKIDDSLVVVNLVTDQILELNETAARLLELLRDGMSRDEAVDALAQEYSVSLQEVSENVDTTIRALVEHRVIEASG